MTCDYIVGIDFSYPQFFDPLMDLKKQVSRPPTCNCIIFRFPCPITTIPFTQKCDLVAQINDKHLVECNLNTSSRVIFCRWLPCYFYYIRCLPLSFLTPYLWLPPLSKVLFLYKFFWLKHTKFMVNLNAVVACISLHSAKICISGVNSKCASKDGTKVRFKMHVMWPDKCVEKGKWGDGPE